MVLLKQLHHFPSALCSQRSLSKDLGDPASLRGCDAEKEPRREEAALRKALTKAARGQSG